MAHGGDEGQLVDESALAHGHDDEDLMAIGGDFRRPAAAGQAHLGLVIIADHGGVEIGEAINLRAAQKAHGHAPALQPVAEHLGHRHGGQRGVAQFAIADGERQHIGLGGDGAGFVDQRDLRRMGVAREIAGGRGGADAHEAHILVAQGAGGGDGHHLVGGIGNAHHAALPPAWTAKASGPLLMTFSSIQARKPSRSREILSQAM